MKFDPEEQLQEFKDIVSFYCFHKSDMKPEDEERYASKISQYASMAYMDETLPEVKRVWRSLLAFNVCMIGKYSC